MKETTGLFDFDVCPSRRILDSWSLNALVTETCMLKNILGLTQYPQTDMAIVCTMFHKSALYFTCIVPVGLTNAQLGHLLLLFILFSCVIYEQMRFLEAKEL